MSSSTIINRSIARPTDLPSSALVDFAAGMQKLPHVLAKLGWPSLRPGQKDVVQTVMLGYDCVGILPTAAGKTGCYVVPALCMGWRTIIISPLLALMADQEASMQRMGVRAARVTSDISDAQAASVLNEWACGNLQIMLVSPERVSNPAWRAVVDQFPPDLIAMDECYAGDVEILTDRGFVRFDELEDGTTCAQVDPDTKEVSYVVPSKFIRRQHDGEIVNIKSEKGVDLSMTPSHDILRYRKDGSWNKVQAGKAKFNHSWRLLGAPLRKAGRDTLTPEERLQVAYQADGNRHSKTFAAFSFSKERKIIRFLKLMEDGGFEWSESADNDDRNRRRFLVRKTAHLSKTMRGNVDLRELSTKGCRALVEEAIAWDGSDISDSLGYFSCTMETNTDFFQEACVLAGMRSRKTKQVDDRKESYKDVHRLFIRHGDPWVDTQNFTSETLPFSGMVYCVEVPTGCIVVRRGGKPVVMGNCHTFSNWADTFRAGFKFAGDFIRAVGPKVVLALSATMPPEMEQEIREGLSIQNARRVFYYPTRKNLKLHTLDLKSPTHFAAWVAANCKGSTIVYCATRENTETICADIQRYVSQDREVLFYHGGITSPAVKKDAQDRWTYSNDAIIVATNAFGMGIDKAGVRNVVHFDLPGTLSALVQEAGRAGRDGEPAFCWAYPNPKSISTQKYFIRIGNPTEADVRAVLEQFRKMSDIDGTIHANRMLVAKTVGIDPKLMGAIMTFMYGEKLVEEVKEAGKPARLKWAEAIPSFTPAEMQTRDALDDVSREDGGWLEFDIEQLAKRLNLKPETVGQRLTSMAGKGLFTYVRQDSRKPIRIIGNPDHVNFARINQKAAEANAKLDEVIAYCDVPDEDKHAYLGRTMKTNEAAPTT